MSFVYFLGGEEMKWNNHDNLKGTHAFLSASDYHWLNYDEEKLATRYSKYNARIIGTRKHDLAAQLIDMGIKLQSKPKNTLAMYVNDAIGFRMKPEQTLYFSENCFGTADAICFRNDKLRIHDLKTGDTPASMNQLLIYSALFCLEYGIKPGEIYTELRIYQSNEIQSMEATAEDIAPIMSKIISYDKLIKKLKTEV